MKYHCIEHQTAMEWDIFIYLITLFLLLFHLLALHITLLSCYLLPFLLLDLEDTNGCSPRLTGLVLGYHTVKKKKKKKRKEIRAWLGVGSWELEVCIDGNGLNIHSLRFVLCLDMLCSLTCIRYRIYAYGYVGPWQRNIHTLV